MIYAEGFLHKKLSANCMVDNLWSTKKRNQAIKQF